MRTFGLVFAACAVLGGCAKPAPMPAPMVSAQRAERGPDHSEAIAQYQKIVTDCQTGLAGLALRIKDDCGLAAFRLAQLYEQDERYSEAAKAYQEVALLSRDPTKISRSMFRAAEILAERLSQLPEALALCQDLIRSHPQEVAAEDALRAMARWRKDDPTFLAELDAVAKTHARHVPLASFAWFLSAERCQTNSKWAEALRRYDELAKRYPKGPLLDDALVQAAKLLRSQKRFSEAAERLERLQRTYTSSYIIGHYNLYLLAESALLLGQIYLQDLRQPARAIASLAGFLKRQPKSRLADDALVLMAEAALLRHNPPTAQDKAEACRYVNALKKQYPDTNQHRKVADLTAQIPCPN